MACRQGCKNTRSVPRPHIFVKRFNMEAAQESDPRSDKLYSYVETQVALAAFFFRSLDSTYRCLLAYNLE